MARRRQVLKDLETMLDVVRLVSIVEKIEKRSKKRPRECWVKSWVARRALAGSGVLSLVHDELAEEDPEKFKNFLRMDEPVFNKLLALVDPIIKKQDTNMRQAVTSRDRLTITLRFLATGESYQSMSFSSRLPACTISLIVPEVCQAIYDVLKEDYLKAPCTEEEWEEIAKDFFQLWNYPNCMGAMDGRHIGFRPPRSAGSAYYNYKSFHSIVLLALVDANYKFIAVDVGTNGRVSDGGIFRESNLYHAIHSNTLNIPPPRPLPQRDMPVPFVIVADDAFSLSEHLMKPYPHRGLSVEQRIHNYRLSRARRISENAFGILTNRFRVLLTTMQLSPEKVQKVTLAACVLHNFLRTETMATYMPTTSIDREENGDIVPGSWRLEGDDNRGIGQQAGNRVSRAPIQIREEFKEYFNNEGAVVWQDQYIFNT